MVAVYRSFTSLFKFISRFFDSSFRIHHSSFDSSKRMMHSFWCIWKWDCLLNFSFCIFTCKRVTVYFFISNMNAFYFLFLTQLLFLGLLILCWTKMKTVGIFRGNACNFFAVEYYVSCGFFLIWPLLWWVMFPLYPLYWKNLL